VVTPCKLADFERFTAMKIQVAVFWVLTSISDVVGCYVQRAVTLNMEAASFSETFVSYHIITRRHNRGWTSGVRFPAGAGIFSIVTASRPAFAPTQSPMRWVLKDFSPGIKRLWP